MRRCLPLLAAAATLVTCQAGASVYFTDPFNVSPTLSATQAPNVWYIDRYAPQNFDSQSFLGGNRLRIGISALDGATTRPPAYSSTFYNTQGRKYDLGNGFYTSIKAELYVAADWSTQLRRSDMWATTLDGTNAISGYPIIGFANVSTTSPNLVCRVYTQDTDQNVGNGYTADWVNVSSKVPGGVTTNRWYSLEMRLKPGCYEFLVDGIVVFSDQVTFDSVKIDNVIMQAYNFNDPTLAAGSFPPGLNDSYDVYWDNFTAGPCPVQAYPVDLNGSYRSSSSGPMNPLGPSSQPGIAVAATVPIGFGNVFERNGVNAVSDNAVNGSFTPFNDSTKIPSALAVASANGTALEADLDLGGTWKAFQFGQGVGNVPPFATGDTFAVGWLNGFNSFGVRLATTTGGQYIAHLASEKLSTGSIAILDTNGTPVTFPAGTTKVRVNASVAGGLLTGTVMALDGPSAYQVFSLGSTDGLNMDTNSPWALNYVGCGYVAGFETHEHVSAAASVTVSNFTTDAVKNAMFSFADDPYVRTADGAINYRIGQANLLQTVSGFQAFMNAQAGQTFASGSYQGPYNQFFPGTIGVALDAAAAGSVENTANVTIAKLIFTPGGAEAATGSGFRPNSGTSVNLFAGGPPNYSDVLATTAASNTVVIDNTAPVLTVPTLGGTGYVAPNVVVGNLEITADATDLGAQQSGLDTRPYGTITWANATTTSVSTISLIGNTFRGTVPITSSTPNGTASLSLTVFDRAGNSTTQTITFNVSTVNIYLTVREKGVDTNVNRVVNITLGSTGGAHTPITVKKLIAFNVFTVAPGVNSREGYAVVTYQDLDMADDNTSNNSVSPVAALTLVYVKDPFFSLGKQEPVVGTPSSLSGVVTLTMGDVTDNNIVNVSDLAVWAVNNGTSQNPNTTLAQPAIPRQANVDGGGIVDLFDRNLILAAWLSVGDTNGVGNFRGGPGDGSQTVLEVVRETRFSKQVVLSMDANGDGIITRDEVIRWRP